MPDAPDLNKLKADYKKVQNEIALLNAKAAGAQAAIKAAEAQLAEIAKAMEGYDKAAPEMQRELDDDEKVIARKRSLAEVETRTSRSRSTRRSPSSTRPSPREARLPRLRPTLPPRPVRRPIRRRKIFGTSKRHLLLSVASRRRSQPSCKSSRPCSMQSLRPKRATMQSRCISTSSRLRP